MASARAKSSGVVILMLPASPAKTATFMPAHSASAASSVKSSRPCSARAAMRGEQRRQRRRPAASAQRAGCPVERLGHARPAVDRLDRVGDRQRRDRGAGLRGGVNRARDQSRAERTVARRRVPARCPACGAASASRPARTEACRVAPPRTGGRNVKPAAAASNRARSSIRITGWIGPMRGWPRSATEGPPEQCRPPMCRNCLGNRRRRECPVRRRR